VYLLSKQYRDLKLTADKTLLRSVELSLLCLLSLLKSALTCGRLAKDKCNMVSTTLSVDSRWKSSITIGLLLISLQLFLVRVCCKFYMYYIVLEVVANIAPFSIV